MTSAKVAKKKCDMYQQGHRCSAPASIATLHVIAGAILREKDRL